MNTQTVDQRLDAVTDELMPGYMFEQVPADSVLRVAIQKIADLQDQLDGK